MKKNIHLLRIAFPFVALTFCCTLFAAESTTAPPTNNGVAPASKTTEPATQNSNKANDAKRVIPTPQANRIRALETDLKQDQLSHQINILNADNTPFLTLYREASNNDSQGCAILFPADNEHPNWPIVIEPLRNALPEFSWCTISIEIPDITKLAQAVKVSPTNEAASSAAQTADTNTLPNQKTVFDRVQAVIDDAKSKGAKQFVFIGYGTGAAYALAYLANNKDSATALALIDSESPKPTSEYALAQQIRQVNVPILDYYYGRSLEKKRFAVWRKQAANQRQGENGDYMQLDAIPETQGALDGRKILIQYVRGFLKQNTSQIDQTKALPEYKKGLFYKSPVSEEETE